MVHIDHTGPGRVWIVIVIVVVFSLEGMFYINYRFPANNEVEFVLPWKINASTDSLQKPLITITQMGRLGNVMFEYAALLATGYLTNKTAVIGPSFSKLKQTFAISLPVCMNQTTLEGMKPFKEVPPQLVKTRERLMNLSSETSAIRLVGYFQSHTYFDAVSDQIRKEFKFNKDILVTVRNFFKTNTGNVSNTVRIGMHIRRTDMNTPLKIKQGYGTPPVTYFFKAMQYFKNKYRNISFIICTDDLRWAVKTFKEYKVVFSRGNLPHIDLAILSSCDHVIISNGTFGWWAGWLCRGTTVRYKRYPPGLHIDKITGEDTYWPPNSTYNHYVTVDS